MRKILLIFLLISPLLAFSQRETLIIELNLGLPDSVKPFPIEDFYKLIFANHPVIRQADLYDKQSKMEVRLARGGFDPKLEGSWDVKNFRDKEYYNVFNATLKIPTWFPVNPKVSVDRNRGVFLNPQNYISESTDYWQYSAGVTIPIGQGLFFDQRRATLQQALIYQDILEAERLKLLNKILLEASKDYWDWYNSYYNYLMLLQSIDIAEEIFRRVKLNYDYGEASVVDTIQAKITLQNRITEMQQAKIEYIKSSLIVSTYLWDQEEAPLELQQNVAPVLSEGDYVFPDDAELLRLRDFAYTEHPELLAVQNKRDQLIIEGRLNREMLKPQIDFSYNFINEPVHPEGELQPFDITDNYKYDLTFGIPLFLRKERAKTQLNEIKVQQTEFAISLKQQQIIAAIDAAYTELIITRDIIDQQRENVANYILLLQAELLNLKMGESDLFKINFQQDKLIEAETKLIKMQANLEKAKMILIWSAGIPELELSK